MISAILLFFVYALGCIFAYGRINAEFYGNRRALAIFMAIGSWKNYFIFVLCSSNAPKRESFSLKFRSNKHSQVTNELQRIDLDIYSYRRNHIQDWENFTELDWKQTNKDPNTINWKGGQNLPGVPVWRYQIQGDDNGNHRRIQSSSKQDSREKTNNRERMDNIWR